MWSANRIESYDEKKTPRLRFDFVTSGKRLNLPVQCPVLNGLGEVGGLDVIEALQVGDGAEAGVEVMDDPANDVFPDTIAALEQDEVLTGRIRNHPTNPDSILLWIFADNLRKGSALNMVHIAEEIIKNGR